LTEFTSKYNLPVEAARGGAETRYPEDQVKIAAEMKKVNTAAAK